MHPTTINDYDYEKKKTKKNKQQQQQQQLEQVKRVYPGFTARGMRFLFHSNLTRIMLTLHRDLAHAHNFLFFWFFLVLSLPQIRGAGWGGACSAPGETR
jgi:hypothetical protein